MSHHAFMIRSEIPGAMLAVSVRSAPGREPPAPPRSKRGPAGPASILPVWAAPPPPECASVCAADSDVSELSQQTRIGLNIVSSVARERLVTLAIQKSVRLRGALRTEMPTWSASGDEQPTRRRRRLRVGNNEESTQPDRKGSRRLAVLSVACDSISDFANAHGPFPASVLNYFHYGGWSAGRHPRKGVFWKRNREKSHVEGR